MSEDYLIMKLNILNVREPQYNVFGSVDLLVTFEGIGEVPFTATDTDPEPHGRELYQNAINGDYGPIAAYEPPPPPSEEELAAMIRDERDRMLRASDWTQLPDVPEATRNLWASYRQALRDVPQQPEFPDSVDWPDPPNT